VASRRQIGAESRLTRENNCDKVSISSKIISCRHRLNDDMPSDVLCDEVAKSDDKLR